MARLDLTRRAGLPALVLALLMGCAAVEHGRRAQDVAGRPLAVRSASGAEHLRAEAAFDPTVARFLANEDKPDYVFVQSRARLYFFYLERDRVVMFERDLQQSEVSDLGRIPGSLLDMLPEREAEAILARRKAASRRAKVAQQRMRPAPAAAAPASAGTYFGAFDVEEIADRMREQPTAADPGVRTWQRGTLQDGRRRLYAKLGSTRYEVRPDAVSVATAAGAKTRGVTRSLRLGIGRVNRAVFPHKGEAVTRVALLLAKQVMADASGRTRVARRVEGRTLRMERRSADGLVIYSLHP